MCFTFRSTFVLTIQLLWLAVTVLYHSLVSLVCFCVPNVLRPKKDVSNDIVLITGGGNGCGRLFALEFTKRGSTVVLWDINQQGAEDVAEECTALGGQAFAYRVDVSNSEAVYKAAAEVRRSVGDVTILVNNAGIVQGKELLEAADHLLHRTIDVNVKAAFWVGKKPFTIEKHKKLLAYMCMVCLTG